MVSIMKYACYVMMHDVMIKHTTGIADNRHGKGKQVTQKPLSLRLAWGPRYYPLEVQLVSTCPNKSNRVLEVLNITDHPPSVMVSAHAIFSCGRNYSESMVSMSVASSINQFSALHRGRLSHYFLWPSWSIIGSKVS